jgi:hypothetical protein
MSGAISNTENSYTYIEVKNLDIDHDIEYNIFIYVHRQSSGTLKTQRAQPGGGGPSA